MKTLIRPQTKINIASFNHQVNHLKERSLYSRSHKDFKFHKKLFFLLTALSIFLIFPESPQNDDALCNKYYSEKVCNVW